MGEDELLYLQNPQMQSFLRSSSCCEQRVNKESIEFGWEVTVGESYGYEHHQELAAHLRIY